MAKKINKCFSGHFYEKQMRQAFFLFILFISQKTDVATFFRMKKDRRGGFETDEGGP